MQDQLGGVARLSRLADVGALPTIEADRHDTASGPLVAVGDCHTCDREAAFDGLPQQERFASDVQCRPAHADAHGRMARADAHGQAAHAGARWRDLDDRWRLRPW
ncbi:hypothetical protein AB0K51_18510 [Kitasatospora sp. NPDC049285]|uniref:hypothetical protein n=1 Tax=Kitasatospora sp. NPDC049285 TaxID=3157096 RepID=UPI00342D7883